jgi:hypothetical protein
MWSKKEILCLRIFLIPVTGFFVFQLFSVFVKSLNDVVYYSTLKTDYHLFLRFDTRETVVLGLSLFWILTLLLFEIVAAFRENFKYSRLLTNLRYAPIAVLFFSPIVVLVFDFAMIEYSKRQIRNYLYSASQAVEKPAITLHNNYRHWCGNGASAQENYLYFETASEGFDNENPIVRARSLLAAAEVRDWLNGGDERFDDFLAKSCRDRENIVRVTAENYLIGSDSSCEKILSTKYFL